MAQGGMTLESQFGLFSKFGDSKSDGKSITLTNLDKWLKQAQVIGKQITTTDTGITFNKFKSRTIKYDDFVKFIEDLASQKKIPADDLKEKLANCGTPGTNPKTTQPSGNAAVDRLTDTSKYTGAHKQRFDESGKGKGIEGREDQTNNTGYVGAYKNKDTYDNK